MGNSNFSYRKDLIETSPMAHLLNQHKNPFAFPNGIFREARLKALVDKAGKSHLDAKAALQKKYFNFENADYSIPLYSFVGRITEQKGVLLILDATETLIQRASGKINILVGGISFSFYFYPFLLASSFLAAFLASLPHWLKNNSYGLNGDSYILKWC